MKPEYKLVSKAKYIRLTAELADTLWRECYHKLYTKKQLDALLQALQSAEAIEEEIDGGANYFIVRLGGEPIGYFAWKTEGSALRLLHIYLAPEHRGRAIGRDIISACERLARGDGKGRVICQVPARCLPEVQFFKARGYRSAAEAGELSVSGVPVSLIEMEHFLR